MEIGRTRYSHPPVVSARVCTHVYITHTHIYTRGGERLILISAPTSCFLPQACLCPSLISLIKPPFSLIFFQVGKGWGRSLSPLPLQVSLKAGIGQTPILAQPLLCHLRQDTTYVDGSGFATSQWKEPHTEFLTWHTVDP